MRNVGRAWRLVPLLWVLARIAGFNWWGRSSHNAGDRLERDRKLASQLVQAVVGVGPLFIKIGQLLSTRVDLLPAPYLDAFAALQDRVPPFPSTEAIARIERELAAPISTLFAHFDPLPVASASLAQVYKARLHSGETVAVKVQRPNLKIAFARDLKLMRWGIRIAERFSLTIRRLGLLPLLAHFETRIYQELDYRLEARNASRFAACFNDHPDLVVPDIFDALSSERVLTMAFMDGVKVTQRTALNEWGVNIQSLTRRAVVLYLEQLLVHGYYHADLHPGNVLVDSQGRLIFLDFGLMGEISPEQRMAMITAFLHLLTGDVAALLVDMRALGFVGDGQSAECLRAPFVWITDTLLDPTHRRVSFKALTEPLAAAFYAEKLQVPHHYALIIRTLIALEGLALQLDQDFDAFDSVMPYVAGLVLSKAGAPVREQVLAALIKPSGIRWPLLYQILAFAKRDRRFRLGWQAPDVLEWFFSAEATPWRKRVLSLLLGEAPIPWQELEQLLAMIEAEGDVDPVVLLGPFLTHLFQGEGQWMRERLVWKLARDVAGGRWGDWFNLYRAMQKLL